MHCLSFDFLLLITHLVYGFFIVFNLIGTLNIFVISSHSPQLQRLAIILLVSQEFQIFYFSIITFENNIEYGMTFFFRVKELKINVVTCYACLTMCLLKNISACSLSVRQFFFWGGNNSAWVKPKKT